MKKQFILLVLILMLTGIVLATAACQPEPEEFDEAALLAVSTYVEEMTAALLEETLMADLQGWVRDYYEEDLPLRYDEERREWLAEHRANLETVRQKHRGGNFPAQDAIAEWQVVIVRGEQEWLLKGGEVVEALDRLDSLTDEIITIFVMIESADGELDMKQSEQVLALVEEIEPRVEEVRKVFRR